MIWVAESTGMAKREQGRAGMPMRWYFCAIVAAAVLAHGLSLGADFYMDDIELILKKVEVREGDWLAFSWRWIPYMGFCLTYKLFGFSAFAFHAWNLSIHMALSCILFIAGRDIFGYLKFLKSPAQRRNAAFLGALLFAAHPLCSEAVNYARCTMIEFVTLFSVVAAWAAVRFFEAQGRLLPIAEPEVLARQQLSRRWGIILGVSVALAAASKNPGLMHALANVGLVCLAMGGAARLMPILKWKPSGGQWLLIIPLMFLAGYLTYSWGREVRGAILRWQDIYFVHTLTQGRIFWEYAERLFWPAQLSSDHYIAWSQGWRDTEAVAKTAALIGLAAAAFAGLFHRRLRIPALLLCLGLAPFLLRFLYPVKELMVEYRAYPSMPWFALLGGAGLAVLGERRRLLGVGVAAALIAGSVARSADRSIDWQSVASLAANVREQYPLNGRAVTHLQGAAFEEGDFARAVALKRDMENLTEQNEAFNAANRGLRAYEYFRMQENYCNAEQIVVYALAEWQGNEAALNYADARLVELVEKLPQFYLDLKRGGYHRENNLVKARTIVAARMEKK